MPSSEEGASLEQLRRRRAARWRRRTMHWAPEISGALNLRRWERMLRGEHSLSFELARLVSRLPGVRKILGLAAPLDTRDDRSLEAREARVAEARASLIGRLARRFERDQHTSTDVVPRGNRPTAFPRIGPLLDREIDAALELLRSVPFEELQWRGWHLQPNHFHSPLNDLRFLREHPELWIREVVPAEVDWDFDGQLQLLERIGRFAHEMKDILEAPPG